MSDARNTNKSSKRSGGSGKSGPSPILIGLAFIVAAAAIYVIMNQRSGGSGKDEAGAVTARDVARELEDLGRTMTIGPGVSSLEAKGSDFVAVEDVDGLGKLLDGRDVAAVIAALEKAGIEHVVVDPSISQRNPIPQNTVRNRLALARPADRLNAVLMSKQLFLFKLGDPPPKLSKDAKQALIQIARKAAGAAGAEAPKERPSIIDEKGDWRAILTVRPVQNRHLSYHTSDSSTLAKLAEKLGKKVVKYYDRRDFADRFGPLSEALNEKITFEFEVIYDRGTFVGPRDNIFLWRVFEPGINGMRFEIDDRNYQLPPWYSVTNNFRTLVSLFEKVIARRADADKEFWKDEKLPIGRFRTIHWRERKPGGEIEDLYRASPGVPTPKEITRERMIEVLKGLGDWLADNQTYPSGRYIYRYFPTKDGENDEYNMVRHALGPFSMALTHEFTPDPKYKEKAEAGMRFMEDRIRWGGPPRSSYGDIDTSKETWMNKPLPGDDVAILEYSEPPSDGWSSKMGAVAVAILGYTQYKRVGWKLSPEREKVLQGLAKFLLYMQKEDGSFHHYYVAQNNKYFGTRNSIYPGELLYAIARLYGETRDERYRTAFKQSMHTNLEWFKKEMDQKEPDGTYAEDRRKNLVQFQPWIAMAMDEMHRYDPDPAYVEASNLVSIWIADTYQFDETRAFFPDYVGGYLKVLDELPAMHTFVYTEGTAASYQLARRAGADAD
ncbi:MAG: hypothetical protein JRF63_01235, partial [Deltaproteobacteria bacterium]|nr:hypothetical protein [Deltaproteobacteria bacterium]